ncbi:MAG TPA: ATP synthase F1 subunit gamma [Bacteroidales bacterium]|nr:ATP synthase F1 subunit gamma [Bacteroidales bacterium]
MPGLKEVRTRIASVKSTQQITNAMKMVAASKFRKAQTAIIKLRPYATKLREILQNLSTSIENSEENIFAQQRKPEKVLLVVITSNRGLCGAFNTNIIKTTVGLLQQDYADQFNNGNLRLLTIGSRATEFFRKRKYPVLESYDSLLDHLKFDAVAPLAEKLMKSFASKEFDRIALVYNQFKNAAVQRLVVEQYLPVALPTASVTAAVKTGTDYIFEPGKETIVRELIPKTLRIQLFKALLDSFASEQGARMTAMQKATDNAQDLLRELNITYNKARQNSITNALIEIVSGAEALK